MLQNVKKYYYSDTYCVLIILVIIYIPRRDLELINCILSYFRFEYITFQDFFMQQHNSYLYDGQSCFILFKTVTYCCKVSYSFYFWDLQDMIFNEYQTADRFYKCIPHWVAIKLCEHSTARRLRYRVSHTRHLNYFILVSN